MVFYHLPIIPIMNFVLFYLSSSCHYYCPSSPLKHQLAMLLVLLELHKHVQMCFTCKVIALNEQAFQKNLTLTGQTCLTSTNAIMQYNESFVSQDWTEIFSQLLNFLTQYTWGTMKNQSCLGPLICTTLQVIVWYCMALKNLKDRWLNRLYLLLVEKYCVTYKNIIAKGKLSAYILCALIVLLKISCI